MNIILNKSADGKLPGFCIFHVLMNFVLGGISSPSPIVTSLTKTMLGKTVSLNRSLGASQSKYEQMAC